jgi:outer membrane protein OmpA-like peptidoglycan-associated protein
MARATSPLATRAFTVFLAAAAAPAAAQLDESVAVERLHLASTRAGVIGLEAPEVPAHLAWEGGGWLGYAKDPLVLVRASDGSRAGALVGNRMGGAAVAALGLLGHAQVAVEVPFVLFQDREVGALRGGAVPSMSAAALGAVCVTPKLVLPAIAGIGWSALLGVRLPTASARSFSGSSGVELVPEVTAGTELGRWRLLGGLGATLREAHAVANLRAASELVAQAGAAFRTGRSAWAPAEWQGTISAISAAARPFAHETETGVEARGAAAWELRGTRLLAGAGVGLTSGWGTPAWRVFVAAQRGPTRAPPVAAAPDPAPQAPVLAPVAPEPEPVATVAPEPALAPTIAPAAPPPDRDGDGVPDDSDRCPDVAGPAEHAGCPETGALRIAADRIDVEGTVAFDTDRDVIQERSFALLDSIAGIIAAHPELGAVRVEGHTDAQGRRAHNVELSRRRAEAVVRYLQAHGVQAGRLEATGFGPDRPIAGNATAEGRARNRRVEFRLTPAPPAVPNADGQESSR